MKIRPVGTELIHADGQTHRRTNGQTDRYDEAPFTILRTCVETAVHVKYRQSV